MSKEIEEYPTTEVKVKVCTRCGLIVKKPHNEYNCPKSTSSKSWKKEDTGYTSRDWAESHPWWS